MNHKVDPFTTADYVDFFENSPVACHTIDEQGRILRVNQTWLRWFGYERDEVEGKLVVFDFLDPAEHERARAGLSILHQSGEIPPFQARMRRKDGSSFPVVVNISRVTDGEGRFVRSRSILTDISDLARSQDRSALLDATPDAIVIADRDGCIQLVNTQAENLFGYSRTELVGQAVEMLLPKGVRERHMAHRTAYHTSPKTRPMGASGQALLAQLHDGTQIPVEISLSPINSGSGQLVIAAVRDISDRKRQEAAARQAMDRLLDAVESVQDAFAIFDGQDQLVLCNSAFRTNLGLPLNGGLVGKPFGDILDAALSHGLLDTNEGGGEGLRARWIGYHKNPEGVLDLRTSDGRNWRVIERRTSEGGRVMTVWDLTEDVRHAAELAEARTQAEAASIAKSEFLSSMSHELRTPLNAILGFTQLLLRDRREPPSPRQRTMLEHVETSGEHLLRLIDEVLDLARVESGRLLLSPEEVELLPVLMDVREALAPLSMSTQVTLVVQAPPPGLGAVRADRTRLRQILMNFSSNALKYSRPGDRAEIFCEQRQGRVRIVVRDNGPGIPADKQARLFQAFYRAGQEAGSIQGTGIGLTICRRLAEAMGGQVGFTSILGNGSEFFVDLPLLLSSEKEVVPTVQPVERSDRLSLPFGPRLRVLYVEDNASNLALMEGVISGLERVDLLVATTAELGIEMAKAQRPNLILMDINLPGMSGYDALQILKAEPETRDIPVFAVSASAMERDVRRATQAGFSRFLSKPFRIAELLEALESVLP